MKDRKTCLFSFGCVGDCSQCDKYYLKADEEGLWEKADSEYDSRSERE